MCRWVFWLSASCVDSRTRHLAGAKSGGIRLDYIGFPLLAVEVGTLQVMVDKGQNWRHIWQQERELGLSILSSSREHPKAGAGIS